MSTDRINRLTDRQRECLRLLYAHYKPGEIATRLGISTDRVNQHLKAARERLGVSRSIDAARQLAAFENASSHAVGDHAVGLVPHPPTADDEPAFDEGADHGATAVLHEELAPYHVEPDPGLAADLPLPLPTRRRPFNELSWYQRLAWGVAIALGATVLAGAMVSLQNAIH